MSHTVWVILIASLITCALRAVPFLLFGRGQRLPVWVEKLSKTLPAAIMAVLVVYCMRSMASQSFAESLPMLIAAVCTVAIHLWRKSTPLSIAAGTIVYMILIRVL